METKRILLVDDDRDLVMSIEAFLSARGFDVDKAHNGKEAYARIVEKRPDLIVLDVMMDYDEEGMVFASALKTDGPLETSPSSCSQASMSNMMSARRSSLRSWVKSGPATPSWRSLSS